MSAKNLDYTLKVTKSIDFGKASDKAITAFLKSAVRKIHNATAKSAPVDTGRLRSSLGPGNVDSLTEVQAPKFGRVGTKVEYAGPLEFGTGRTRKHVGWFRAGVDQGMAKIGEAAEEAGAVIKKEWNEGGVKAL